MAWVFHGLCATSSRPIGLGSGPARGKVVRTGHGRSHDHPRYSVSPQISAEDVPAIVAAGFKTVICNRPDAEVPPSHQAEAIGAAVAEAGLRFEVLPLTHQTMNAENVARQRALYEGCEGPVLAYCASGTRCSVVWALSQSGDLDVDVILATTQEAGYDLGGLRPTLEALAAK